MAASSAWIRSSMSQSGISTAKRRVRRVLIVDDHPIVRQGLRRIMENEEDLIVCGEAETARDVTPTMMVSGGSGEGCGKSIRTGPPLSPPQLSRPSPPAALDSTGQRGLEQARLRR